MPNSGNNPYRSRRSAAALRALLQWPPFAAPDLPLGAGLSAGPDKRRQPEITPMTLATGLRSGPDPKREQDLGHGFDKFGST